MSGAPSIKTPLGEAFVALDPGRPGGHGAVPRDGGTIATRGAAEVDEALDRAVAAFDELSATVRGQEGAIAASVASNRRCCAPLAERRARP